MSRTREEAPEMTNATAGASVAELTPRQLDVVVLIGRDDLSYQAAARQMRNRNLRRMADSLDELPTVSPRTVEQYACQVRDAIGSTDIPTRALRAFYQAHREAIHQAIEERRASRSTDSGDEEDA